jgi:hypothetical protein
MKMAEENLKKIYDELYENAYDIDFHGYHYKEANQIIRKHFEAYALLEKELEQKPEHETCDGCVMFQDCGCMLDDSCPPCFEHSSWTPKHNPKIISEKKSGLKEQMLAEIFKEIYDIVDDYLSNKQKL